MADRLPCIAVVGHTNAGKTSLLRTLTRQVAFGRVSDRPGTTRHAEAVALRLGGQEQVHFVDTPGLEDAVALGEFLQQQAGDTRLQRMQAFLRGPEARGGAFEQEAKVLRTLLERADAAMLVLDVREQHEYDAGHLSGSLLIPLGQLSDRIAELEQQKDRPIVVICHGGKRSADACAVLAERGFANTFNIAGGILAWRRANLATTL